MAKILYGNKPSKNNINFHYRLDSKLENDLVMIMEKFNIKKHLKESDVELKKNFHICNGNEVTQSLTMDTSRNFSQQKLNQRRKPVHGNISNF